MAVEHIAPLFDVAGRLVSVSPVGDGNVNDTYLAIMRTTFSEERFILQRINRNVFPRPETIMENMRVLTEHAQHKFEAEFEDSDRIWQIPRVIPAKDGNDYAIGKHGGFWRAISLIASAHSFAQVQSLEHAHEAGYVLGKFQQVLSDLPVDKLHDTLEGFHITPGYLAQLDESLTHPEGQERMKSSSEAERCFRFIQKRRDWCTVLEDAKERGELQLRIIHGDPKISNIMIDDATGKGTSIIDLDTVKPGLIHYDIGDCLRSTCNRAGEETKDLKQVQFDLDLCKVILDGYMTHANDFLTEQDRHYL